MLVAWIETLKQLSRLVIRSRDLNLESSVFATQNNRRTLKSDVVVLDTFSKLACKIWARTGHEPGTKRAQNQFLIKKMLARRSVSLQAYDLVTYILVVVGGLESEA